MSTCIEGVVSALNTNIYGNGTQTIVLSHGYGCDQSVWHYLVPVLALYFRVVVYDLVIAPKVDPKLYDRVRYSSFCGYAQDLTCILDEIQVNNTIFVGHSMSAMIGAIAATQRPELFNHLVLLAGSPRYLNTAGYDGGFSRQDLNMLFRSIQQNYSDWVVGFAPTVIIVNDTNAISEFEGTLGSMDPDISLDAARMIFLKDNRGILPKVRIATDIIQTEKDIIVPSSVPVYMKNNLGAGANITVLKTQGHFPHLTDPQLLLSALNDILGWNETAGKDDQKNLSEMDL